MSANTVLEKIAEAAFEDEMEKMASEDQKKSRLIGALKGAGIGAGALTGLVGLSLLGTKFGYGGFKIKNPSFLNKITDKLKDTVRTTGDFGTLAVGAPAMIGAVAGAGAAGLTQSVKGALKGSKSPVQLFKSTGRFRKIQHGMFNLRDPRAREILNGAGIGAMAGAPIAYIGGGAALGAAFPGKKKS